MSKNWKVIERKIARMLGVLRIPVTGRFRGSAPDIEFVDVPNTNITLAVEIKHRTAVPDSYVLKEDIPFESAIRTEFNGGVVFTHLVDLKPIHKGEYGSPFVRNAMDQAVASKDHFITHKDVIPVAIIHKKNTRIARACVVMSMDSYKILLNERDTLEKKPMFGKFCDVFICSTVDGEQFVMMKLEEFARFVGVYKSDSSDCAFDSAHWKRREGHVPNYNTGSPYGNLKVGIGC